MIISQTSEYALRAILFMAQHSDHSHIVSEIAAATKVPPGYLCKVLQILSRAKLVVSQRGLGGGFALTKTPLQMTMFDVIEAVDPIQHNKSCPLKLLLHSLPLCLLHRRLHEVITTTETNFRAITIADLMHEPGNGRMVYTFPCKCHAVTPLPFDANSTHSAPSTPETSDISTTSLPPEGATAVNS